MFFGNETANGALIQPFDDMFKQTINEELNHIFGSEAAESILRHLDTADSIEHKKEGVKSFTQSLHTALGPNAIPLQRIILMRLYSKLELKLEYKKGYDFSDYVNEIISIRGTY